MNKDEEIKKKLDELETTILKEQKSKPDLPATSEPHKLIVTSTSTSTPPAPAGKSDLYYFGGLALVVLGLVLLFQHVRVGTGFMGMLGLGGAGFGYLLLPLLIGIGWLFYDYKNKFAWLLTGVSCFVMLLSILGSMIMTFPTLTLLETIMILAPLAFGGALLLKGAGGPSEVAEKIKKLK
jgi:hypothetical protein